MKINKNAMAVLEKRYLIKDENGVSVESVEGMFRRVADSIAAADKNYGAADVSALSDRFYQLMTDLEFLPNSPTLMNAGRPLGQLSACFVLPIPDSMDQIFEAVKDAALIHKSGGGTGFSFSRLRAKGSTVRTTGGVASGPVSFMRVFNMATEAVKQGGTRRGANMGILRVDHPDILEFIDCKKDNSDITNFNISIGITEKFMRAVEAHEDYDIVEPHTGDVVARLNAGVVFDKIVEGAWRNGEPGIIFLDRLNRDNVVPSQGEIESTNPCGEQPLLPYESCNLGSINLVTVLKEGEDRPEVDYDKLEGIVRDAVHFLDNVIDVNKYPLEQIDRMTKSTRKIGLGIMGWADMLLRLGVPYDSDEAVAFAEELMGFITDKARDASRELAVVRGPFPLFGESVWKDGEPLRNATVTTIAPTGTLSIIAGCSSGVEPVFAYAFIRNIMDNTEMLEVSPILRQKLEEAGIYSDELMKKVVADGSLAHILEIPQYIRDVFVSAHDVSPEYHVRMQAAFQRHTDNAVSKTVNFSNSATVESVREVFMLAYKLDCKGVTIYRDGSRDLQVLNIGEVKGSENAHPEPEHSYETRTDLLPRPRPDVVNGVTERVKIGCGNLYVTVNYDEHGIVEVFTSTGKAGGCPSQSEATARLCSVALRSGVSLQEIMKQMRGIRCPSTVRVPGLKCTSCPDAIARVMKRVSDMIESGAQVPTVESSPELEPQVFGPARDNATVKCPECGAALTHEGGCVTCPSCGYSKCS